MKRIHLLAMLAALALAVTSCGGSDDGKDTSTQAAGTSTPEQTAQSPAETQQEPADRAKPDAQNGNGGSSASDAQRAAGSDQASGSKPTTAPSTGGASGDKKQKSSKPKTPEEQIAALSPAKRRALHKDLYEQGQKLCYAYGPKELAKSYNLTGSSPETIASQYARAYEAATPTLILPYQQGCLAGFRKFARNPPKN